MDFEKLYKEALERVKAGKPMNEVFPELKESEDERIRKYIITRVMEEENIPHYLRELIIAYLEKQKEQKHKFKVGDTIRHKKYPTESYKITSMYKDIMYISGKTEETSIRIPVANQDLWELVGKPAEWSEEEETNGWMGVDLERYLSCLQRLGTGNPQQPETINSKWFKEHCRFQPHWKPSEEQIEAIDLAIRFVTDDFDEHPTLSETLRGLYNELKKL